MDWKRISEGHERLKRRIHNARMPLPRWAIPIAKLVYFSIPVAFGVWLMMWTFEQMDKNVGTLETKALAKLEGSAKAETATPADRQRLDALRERIRIASERRANAAPGQDRA